MMGIESAISKADVSSLITMHPMSYTDTLNFLNLVLEILSMGLSMIESATVLVSVQGRGITASRFVFLRAATVGIKRSMTCKTFWVHIIILTIKKIHHNF